MGKDAKARKKMSTRASRIRKRMRDGKEVTADEKAFMLAWDKQKTNKGPKPAPISPDAETGEDTKPEIPSKKTEEKPPESPATSAEKPPEAPPLKSSPGMGKPVPPPPPLVKVKTSGDWRDKYRSGASNDSREQTCVQLANQWQGILTRMVRDIHRLDPEAKVWFDEAEIRSNLYMPMVLTVDKILPSGFEVGPEVTVAIGTSSVITQRWLAGRKAAKKAAEKSASIRTAAQYVSDKPEKVVNEKPETEDQARDAAVVGSAMVMGDVPENWDGPV